MCVARFSKGHGSSRALSCGVDPCLWPNAFDWLTLKGLDTLAAILPGVAQRHYPSVCVLLLLLPQRGLVVLVLVLHAENEDFDASNKG